MTNYTAKQRQQIAAALRGCKKRLSWGVDLTGNKNYLICFALSETQGADLARKIIHERLGGHASVVNWLMAGGYLRVGDYNFRENVQTYRHRWVDALIQEFSQ